MSFDQRPPGADGKGTGRDLDDCKRQFKVAWARVRAGLTEEDIETARRNDEQAVRRTRRAAHRSRTDLLSICDVTGHSYQSAQMIMKHYRARNAARADAAIDRLVAFMSKEEMTG